MTARLTAVGVCAATLSLALPSSALAGPAGSEYLPKIPQSGAHSSSGEAGVSTGTVPDYSSGSTGTAQQPHKKPKQHKKQPQAAKPAVPASGSSGGGSSGSILLSPLVLLMVAGVIVIAVGMTLRRRQTRSLRHRTEQHRPEPPPRNSRPTPQGEIVGGADKAP